MSKCLKNYLTYRRIFSRLSIVKTSFSLHSLLENLVLCSLIRIFVHEITTNVDMQRTEAIYNALNMRGLKTAI